MGNRVKHWLFTHREIAVVSFRPALRLEYKFQYVGRILSGKLPGSPMVGGNPSVDARIGSVGTTDLVAGYWDNLENY